MNERSSVSDSTSTGSPHTGLPNRSVSRAVNVTDARRFIVTSVEPVTLNDAGAAARVSTEKGKARLVPGTVAVIWVNPIDVPGVIFTVARPSAPVRAWGDEAQPT